MTRSPRSLPGTGPSLLPLILLLGSVGSASAQEGGGADPDSAAETPAAEKAAAGVSADGLYTEAQAERGEIVFRTRCAACHVSSQFRGEAFRFQWGGRTAFDLVDRLRATMPGDAPGGLPGRAYVDVAAYLFRLNRYPAAEEELPAEDARLEEIRIPPEVTARPPGDASRPQDGRR